MFLVGLFERSLITWHGAERMKPKDSQVGARFVVVIIIIIIVIIIIIIIIIAIIIIVIIVIVIIIIIIITIITNSPLGCKQS